MQEKQLAKTAVFSSMQAVAYIASNANSIDTTTITVGPVYVKQKKTNNLKVFIQFNALNAGRIEPGLIYTSNTIGI